MNLNNENYYSLEAGRNYWSVSQFKSFNKCEACGLAESKGLYERPETDALLIGSYVDAYFSGEFEKFQEERGSMMFKKNGDLLAKFVHANDMINCLESQPTLLDYLEGEKQTIMSASLFNVDWKIKMDVYNEQRIVDLKTVKDFNDIYEPGFGYKSWITYWGYDIQGAIYTRIEQKVSGRDKPLPFYIVAVTKEPVPDVALIQLDDDVLDEAYHLVEAKIERFDMIKNGEIDPIRCEKCDYCKSTKIITEPKKFNVEDAAGC